MLEVLFTPFAQDPAYHWFADNRTLLGIPNFWNVASNLPLMIVGGLGLVFLARQRPGMAPLRYQWAVFFLGVLATSLSSAYYHLAPENATLALDRLTMTVGFMGLLGLVIGEYVSISWANRLLVPLLVLGAASVFYWLHTEARGHGDLRPYAIIQFLPMLLIPLLMWLRSGHSHLTRYLGALIAFYIAAKVCEHYDARLFAAGELISGHTLKHVLAAFAAATMLWGLHRSPHKPAPGA